MKPKNRIAEFTLLVFAWSLSGALVWGTEKQIAALEEDIAAIKAKIAETGAAGEEVARLQANIDSAKKEISEASAALSEREKSIAAKEFLLGVYQGSFRVVTTLVPGTDLGAIVLRNGESVPPSSFVSASKGTILVQMATGSRSIPVDMLPDSFTGRITMPPAVNPPATTLASVKSSKPDAIRTDSEKSVASHPSAASAGGSDGGAAAPGGAAKAADEGSSSREAIIQRNDARLKQINELKLRFADLFTQKKIARQERASSDKIFREAKIKKSQSEISTTLKMHDDKISRIETEESELRKQIARIQSEME